MRKPNFDNLRRVLDRQRPDRPTLFEFFLNHPLYERLAGRTAPEPKRWGPTLEWQRLAMQAFAAAGYDYVTVMASDFHFPKDHPGRPEIQGMASRSMNDTAVITDRASFKAYPWPDPDAFDYSNLDKLGKELPAGMKMIVCGPGGVLENIMEMVGYEPLCYMLADDPDLARDVIDAVGSRFLRYYELSAGHPAVGAVISNDDWGFATQPMFPPDVLRKYIFPWHRKIVQTIHAAGKPAILHSCGQLDSVMDEIIDGLQYDGKHSYEDKILPVEQAYERWGRRIAILGGIDLDFVCRSAPQQVHRRSADMLDRARERGSYALGTGNSVPVYVPQESYFAMISAATG